MPNYRRYRMEGGCYFFTVNLQDRQQHLLTQQIELLRESFRLVKHNKPFHIDAIVILPEHIHCIWTLPKHDDDYSGRWRAIKKHFSKSLSKTEPRPINRIRRNERSIWQRRFWEHTIRGDQDYANHVDYIHYNPVKHGWVKTPMQWPHSTYHRYLNDGIYSPDWGCIEPNITGNFGE